LGWIEQLRPSRSVLTHMSHHTDYRTIEAKLPPGVVPAHDGMVIEI
jgi:phosphoribosyl 1,2-cyclic phosphate phosphodiesterase